MDDEKKPEQLYAVFNSDAYHECLFLDKTSAGVSLERAIEIAHSYETRTSYVVALPIVAIVEPTEEESPFY